MSRLRALLFAFAIVAVVGVFALLPTNVARPTVYANCDQARAAGPTPIREGEDGYAPHLDADRDGLACE